MDKKELLEVFEMLDIEILQNLFLLSKTFKPEELNKITEKVQDKSTKQLILKYI
ncbi:MAG: hypothetical protein L3J35_03665 [Bacteroidales bacterium]|nr:hypothetical protein [Bacteroidales bacterium]